MQILLRKIDLKLKLSQSQVIGPVGFLVVVFYVVYRVILRFIQIIIFTSKQCLMKNYIFNNCAL